MACIGGQRSLVLSLHMIDFSNVAKYMQHFIFCNSIDLPDR
jgi:hypothetical protein